MKKLFNTSLLLLLIAVSITSCKKKEHFKPELEWQVYTYPDFNGKAYLSMQKDKLYGVICADVSGIQGSLKISHKCTEEQFKNLRPKFEAMGAEYLGTADSPDTSGFPDLSQYLTFVISSDELDEIWRNLGLLEDEAQVDE